MNENEDRFREQREEEWRRAQALNPKTEAERARLSAKQRRIDAGLEKYSPDVQRAVDEMLAEQAENYRKSRTPFDPGSDIPSTIYGPARKVEKPFLVPKPLPKKEEGEERHLAA